MELSVPWLTLMVFSPLAGALALALVPDEHKEAHRLVGGFFASLPLVVFMAIFAAFDPTNGGYQLTSAAEDVAWIPAIGARYHLAIDGISLWLAGLTSLLGVVAVLAGVTSIHDRTRAFHTALLVLQTAVLGAICSVDLLLFAFFWELMLVPLALLVGLWGDAGRVRAAMRLFAITLAASMPLMAGILYLWSQGGGTSFDAEHLAAIARGLSPTAQQWLFIAFCIAFFVKLPLVPLHTWLPEAQAQASTAGSFVLGAIVFNAGTYGLFRFAVPFFPDAVYWAAPAIAVLSTLAIVYAAVIAVTQRDIKRMIAYSSVSHLGFITLGLFALNHVGATGALVQALAHGITAGALFLATGVLIDRHQTRDIDGFGGLAARMPLFAALFIFLVMAYAGVPGLVGFVGEFLVLAGTADSWAFSLTPANTHLGGLGTGPDVAALVLAGLAGLRVIIGAIYLLALVRRMVLGPLPAARFDGTRDVTLAEAAPLLPLAALCLWMGMQPGFFTSRSDAAVAKLLSDVAAHANAASETATQTAGKESAVRTWYEGGKAQAWSIQREKGHDPGGHAEPKEPAAEPAPQGGTP
jgi:NADH-quinone oxidoreductase subunit M